MSFRNEEKIHLNKSKLFLFKDYLYKKKAQKIFETRKINSIYFDNKNFDMYNHSIEGLVPRKKIRIRYYNENDKERIKIAKAGYNKYHKYMNNLVITNYIMTSVGLENYKKPYWHDIK